MFRRIFTPKQAQPATTAPRHENADLANHMAARMKPSEVVRLEPKGMGKKALDALTNFFRSLFRRDPGPFGTPKRSDNKGRAYYMRLQRSYNELREQKPPSFWTVGEWLVYCARNRKHPSSRDRHRRNAHSISFVRTGKENQNKQIRAILGRMQMTENILAKLENRRANKLRFRRAQVAAAT